MHLNCILQDLIRDIPLDHIWHAQIRAQIRPNTPNIVFGVRIWDTLMTITKHGLYKYEYKFVLLSQKPVTLQPHYNDHWPDCEKTYLTNHKPEYDNPLHENCYCPYWRWQLNMAKITSTLIYRTHIFSLKTHLKTQWHGTYIFPTKPHMMDVEGDDGHGGGKGDQADGDPVIQSCDLNSDFF